MQFVDFFNNFNPYFTLLITILSWFFGSLNPKLQKKYKWYKIVRLFQLKKGKTNIILPIRTGNLLDITNQKTKCDSEYIAFNESMAYSELLLLFNEVSFKSELVVEKDIDKVPFEGNVFCVGGPLSNNQTRFLFKQIFKTNNIKFSIADEKYKLHKDNCEFKDFISSNNDINLKESFKEENIGLSYIELNNKIFFKYNREKEGYIFLLKTNGKKIFGDADIGTIHICFGSNDFYSLLAVKSYRKSIKNLYKILKGKSEYIIIIKCSQNGDLQFNQIKDLSYILNDDYKDL